MKKSVLARISTTTTPFATLLLINTCNTSPLSSTLQNPLLYRPFCSTNTLPHILLYHTFYFTKILYSTNTKILYSTKHKNILLYKIQNTLLYKIQNTLLYNILYSTKHS